MAQGTGPSIKELASALRQLMQTIDLRALRDWARFLRAKGFSMPQFGVLMRLYHHGACGISEIGGHMDISTAAASQLVDRLVQQGLVERREDQRDRRVRTLSLTADGKALVEAAIAERYRWLDELVPRLSPERRAALAAALPALAETARADGQLRDALEE